MRGRHRVVPTGLSVDGHQCLAGDLQDLEQQLSSLRATIRDSFGSASDPYQALQRIFYNLKSLKGALESELIEQHSDVATKMLRGIYHHDQEV